MGWLARTHRTRARAILAAGLIAGLSPSAVRAQGAPDPTAFESCFGELTGVALARGVPRGIAERTLAGLTPDPDVIAATAGQSEFTAPVWSYLDAGATAARVAEGQRRIEALGPTLAAIEARYGVDRHVLVAFWGVESSYGAVLDDPRVVKPVVRSLATLACGDTGRAPYWRSELSAALTILAGGEAPLDRLPGGQLTGSWAGAMGHTQFMPSVYLARAVDFDGDGRRDIWTSVPDALASTAAYLVASGWRRGERWGAEADLPEGFDPALADETTPRSLDAWGALGVRPVRDIGADGSVQATLYLPAGWRGPAFLLLPNFSAILRYNTAFSYALTVGHLSDRLRGEPGFTHDWPRGDRGLTTDERRDLQSRLAARGLAIGAIDGKVGPRTRAAIRAFQAGRGLPADGYADAALLEQVRAAP